MGPCQLTQGQCWQSPIKSKLTKVHPSSYLYSWGGVREEAMGRGTLLEVERDKNNNSISSGQQAREELCVPHNPKILSPSSRGKNKRWWS